jgi:hypothetical protein
MRLEYPACNLHTKLQKTQLENARSAVLLLLVVPTSAFGLTVYAAFETMQQLLTGRKKG